MNRQLYLGCSPGEDVRLLQNDLNAVTALPSQKSGLAPLVADGAFGSKTGARVQEFQSMNGLTADGVVGPKTLGALHSALQEAPGAPAAEPVKGAASPPAYSGGPPYGKPVPPSEAKAYTSAGMKSHGGSGAGGGSGSGSAGGSGSGSGGVTKSW
jgi:peptidoglycan hydrolase-like protein with peptidoglycan-binding domain